MNKSNEETYNQIARTEAKPDAFISDLASLRKLWGDEAVDKGLADGTIKFLDEEPETNEVSN